MRDFLLPNTKYFSVTVTLLKLGLPSFNTLLYNNRVKFTLLRTVLLRS